LIFKPQFPDFSIFLFQLLFVNEFKLCDKIMLNLLLLLKYLWFEIFKLLFHFIYFRSEFWSKSKVFHFPFVIMLFYFWCSTLRTFGLKDAICLWKWILTTFSIISISCYDNSIPFALWRSSFFWWSLFAFF